ncbi:MAG: CVNH domain-containing protein [Burkholderiales bacterium]|nr:CVNH domain-containing protein [Burkholderiales bacterium]
MQFNKNTCLMLLISAGIVACNSGSNGTTASDATISKSTTGMFSGTNPVKNLGWNVVVTNNSNESYIVTGIGGHGNKNWNSYDFDHKQIVAPHDSRIFYTEANSDGYQSLRVYAIPPNSDPDNFNPATWKSVTLHEENDGKGNYIINDDDLSKGLAIYNHPEDTAGVIGGGTLFYASIDSVKSGIVSMVNWVVPASQILSNTPSVADSYLAAESNVANVVFHSPAGFAGDYLRTREDKQNKEYKYNVELELKEIGGYAGFSGGAAGLWYFSSKMAKNATELEQFKREANEVLETLIKITRTKQAIVGNQQRAIARDYQDYKQKLRDDSMPEVKVEPNSFAEACKNYGELLCAARRQKDEARNADTLEGLAADEQQVTGILEKDRALFDEYNLSQVVEVFQAQNVFLNKQLELEAKVNEYTKAIVAIPDNDSATALTTFLSKTSPEDLNLLVEKYHDLTLNELIRQLKDKPAAVDAFNRTADRLNRFAQAAIIPDAPAMDSLGRDVSGGTEALKDKGFGKFTVKDLQLKLQINDLATDVFKAKYMYAEKSAVFITAFDKNEPWSLLNAAQFNNTDRVERLIKGNIRRKEPLDPLIAYISSDANVKSTNDYHILTDSYATEEFINSQLSTSASLFKTLSILGRTIVVGMDVAAVVVPIGLALNDLYAKDRVTTSFTINNDGSLKVGYMASVRYGTYLNSCMYDVESSNGNTLSAWCLNDNMKLESAIDGTPITSQLDVNSCKDSEDIWNKNGKLQCVSSGLTLNANQLPVGDYANSCSELSYVDNVLRGKCKNSHGALVSSELYTEKLCDSSMSVRNNDGYLECGLWQIGSIKINSNNNTNAPKGSYQNSCHIRGFDGVILAGSCKNSKGDYENTVLNYPAKCAVGSGVENISGGLRCQAWR